ncbi:hypothetical protein BC834DRAFT_879387 [Gloeopeniophorella convolvens]|nr:hypothetical protein BC834DRAFT_879387 [Gloeopeniophorella convolvens]
MLALLSLPVEIIIQILTQLSLEDVAACKACCRRLSCLITESPHLQYLIRAWRSGVEPDFPFPGLSLPDHFQALRRWEEAWLRLEMSDSPATCAFDTHKKIGYNLYGDMLIALRRARTPLFSTRPGYSYIDLHSQENGARPVAQWTHVDFSADGHPRRFGAALDEDLLVVAIARHQRYELTLIFRFYQLSTGGLHPMALRQEMEIGLEGNLWDCTMTLEVAGDYAALMITQMWDARQCERLFLVDWKRGYISCIRSSKQPTYAPVLAFLDKKTLLFAQREKFALEICKLEGGWPPKLQSLCVLLLPSLRAEVFDIVILPQKGDTSPCSPSSALSHTSSRSPFRTSPRSSIIGFNVSMRCDLEQEGFVTPQRGFSFWTHRRTLLRMARTAEGVVPWNEWGPQSTRWIEQVAFMGHVHFMCSGDRAALVQRVLLEPMEYNLEVFDFNTSRVRGAEANLLHDDRDGETAFGPIVVSEPSVLEAGTFLQHDIVSSLPYCLSSLRNVPETVMISGNWLLQFKTSSEVGNRVEIHAIG